MGFFYPQWQKIIRIAVTTPPTTTGYQVKVEIPWQPGMKDDFSDLRFSDYLRTLPYWIETSTTGTTATVWIKLTEINSAASEFFCYYGNGGAVSESNGDTVFNFFDHFAGASWDTNKWTVQPNDATTFSNSIARIKSTAVTYGGCLGKTGFSTNYALEVYGQIDSGGDVGCIQPLGFASSINWVPTHLTVVYTASGSINLINHNPSDTVVVSNYTLGVFKRWSIVRNGSTNTRYFENGVELTGSPISTNVPTGTLYVYTQTNRATIGFYLDWVGVRKYQSTEPVCTPAAYGVNTAFYYMTRYIRYLRGVTLTAVQHLTHIDLTWSD